MEEQDQAGRAARLAERVVTSPGGKITAGTVMWGTVMFIAYLLSNIQADMSTMQYDMRTILLDGEKRQAAIQANASAIHRLENRIDAASDAARDVGVRLTAHERAASERLDKWTNAFSAWSANQR